MVELSTDLAVGINCFRMTEMTESFPSRENSPVNSHVRAKPLPSHQLKNNTLGFGKNVILGGLRSLWFWPFKVALVLSFQRTSQLRNSLQLAPEAEALRTSVRVRLSPVRLGTAASVCGSSKGLQNPRGPSKKNYRQTKSISAPTATSPLEIPKGTYNSKSTDRLPQIQTDESLFHDWFHSYE